MQSSNTLTATALLLHHSQWLSSNGVSGGSRYSQALYNLIADQERKRQAAKLNRALLVTIRGYSSRKQTEIANEASGKPEAEQRVALNKYMQYQAIIEKANEALDNGSRNRI